MFLWSFRDRSVEPVKTEPFALSWSKPNRPAVAALGVRLTPTKVVFRTQNPPSHKEFDIQFRLYSRIVQARVKSTRPKLIATTEGYQHEIVCRFLGIRADDWDCIMRYLRDEEEAAFSGSLFDPNSPDDEFRGLPMVTQQQIIADLVHRGRLNASATGTAPLIRMRHQGTTSDKEGTSVEQFSIRSRFVRADDGVTRDFETQYTVAENHVKSVAPAHKGLFGANHWQEGKHSVRHKV